MSQLPTKVSDFQITSGPTNTDAKALSTIVGAGFMPYIILASGSSNVCKEGKVPVGVYALMKGKEPVNLGKSFIAWFIHWRPRAMRMDKAAGNHSYYQIENPEFQKIVATANSGVKLSGCMYGPEILVWLFEQNMFATMFWSNPTMRNEYANLAPMQGEVVTFSADLIVTPDYKWHGPKVALCQSPPANMPDRDDFKITLDRFNNPPVTEIEKVEEPSSNSNERPQ